MSKPVNDKQGHVFEDMFYLQLENQSKLIDMGAYDGFKSVDSDKPTDDPKLCSYHIQQLVSEIGEVLEADKRWKNFRNDKYDKANKLEEIADCFIVLMNVCMFSGYSASDVCDSIMSKIAKVSNRIDKID